MEELINGRTPEDIKFGLRCRVIGDAECSDCAYYGTVLYEIGQREYECDDIDRDALDLIESLESERDAALAKVPKWISVEERLPERYTPVLILVKRMPDNPNSSYICLVGVYDGDYWMKDSGHYYDDIDGEAVCWMPLPEPPKGE